MSGWLRVVVGVDGSAESHKALRWAYDEARAHDAELVVVGARVILPVTAMGYAGFDWSAEIESPEQTQAILDQSVRSVLGDDVAGVRTVVVDGVPSMALIHESEGADLLVVGSRGHGAFTGMLLGSVSLHVTTHARCPVTVVR